MGPVTLPTVGLVYADAPVIIYSVEKHPIYWPRLEPLWLAIEAGSLNLVSSELVLMVARADHPADPPRSGPPSGGGPGAPDARRDSRRHRPAFRGRFLRDERCRLPPRARPRPDPDRRPGHALTANGHPTR